MKNELDHITVKMFRQGLGDCFLLSFYYKDQGKNCHMLIDCGVLSKDEKTVEEMKRVAREIKDLTGSQIEILVATHEHWDHLSGFLQASEIFDSIEIKELWMAWTEDPADDDAQRLKEAHDKKFKIIQLAFDRLKDEDVLSINQQSAFHSFFSLFGVESSETAGLKEKETTAAFQAIKKHKNTKKKYLLPGKVLTREQGIPGVRFYVLGPPKDKKLLRKMNPSRRNSETYANLGLSSFGDNLYHALSAESDHMQDAFTPFRKSIGFSLENLKDHRESHPVPDPKNDYVDIFEEYLDSKNKWRQIETEWLNMAGSMAIHLDNAINNTSLVIAIEMIDSGKILFFPGDAQVGNWLSWKNYVWEVRDDDGTKTVTIEDILARTVFYKVSHHGSHNATLKEDGLEKMTDDSLVAMIPVDKEIARKRGWSMPYDKLLEKLDEKASRIFISDTDHEETSKKGPYHETVIRNE